MLRTATCLCVFALLFATPIAFAGNVQVSGEAEIRVQPDEALISTGIEVRAAALDDATTMLEERRARLLEYLQASGIADQDVRTDFVLVEPVYRERNRADVPNDRELLASIVDPIAYNVVQLVRVRVRQVNQFDALIVGVLKNGANRLEGVEFRTTELRKYRDEARQKAIRAAKEKALLLVAELNVKLGDVVAIQEQYSGGWWSWPRYQNQALMQNVTSEAPAASNSTAGQISVTASVHLTFALPGGEPEQDGTAVPQGLRR
ncbi:MAG: SIMPL domain-containing protein [Pirellulales bacterium]|nr:SIMPL domain-containing protein [Pirellulales bacterium]